MGSRKLALQEKGAGGCFTAEHAQCLLLPSAAGPWGAVVGALTPGDAQGCPRLRRAVLQAGVSLSPRHPDLARFGTRCTRLLSTSAGFKSRKAAKDEGDAVLCLWRHWIPLLHGGTYPGGVGWAEARLSLAGEILGKQVWEGGGRGMVTPPMQWVTGWEPQCWQYQGGWEHWFPPAGSGRS